MSIQMKITNLQPRVNRTAIVLIVDGDYKGRKAYVTWVEESSGCLRVTPIDGDPMLSITLKSDQVHFLEFKLHGDQ